MNCRHFLAAAASVPLASWALPFDREVISRLSLDGKPRSLSIRQGPDVWIGYDLERATVFKAWQAPAGKSGLTKLTFVTRSVGKALFEDTTSNSWTLQRGGKTLSLAIRYLGCTDAADHIALRWELKHGDDVMKLHEHIPLAAAAPTERVLRELRVESLPAGSSLQLPESAQKAWKVKGSTTAALTSAGVHVLTLP